MKPRDTRPWRDRGLQALQTLSRLLRGRAPRRQVQVLVLGDSHVRVFEHWRLRWHLPHVHWHIHYVPGATATGLPNPQAATRARSRFELALQQCQPQPDWVIVNLGEVDTGHLIWVKAERQGSSPQAMLDLAVNRYLAFIGQLSASCRVLVLSAPLPTLPDGFQPHDDVSAMRQSVQASQLERTALTLQFNERVAQGCRALGVVALQDAQASMGPGGVVHPAWLSARQGDHHYARSRYARWLAGALKPHLAAP